MYRDILCKYSKLNINENSGIYYYPIITIKSEYRLSVMQTIKLLLFYYQLITYLIFKLNFNILSTRVISYMSKSVTGHYPGYSVGPSAPYIVWRNCSAICRWTCNQRLSSPVLNNWVVIHLSINDQRIGFIGANEPVIGQLFCHDMPH